MLTVHIPGEPVAQGRPRFRRGPKFVSTYDPAKSRNWKAEARAAMVAARAGNALPFAEGALMVVIWAAFTCPKGEHRKREPRPPRWKHTKPDAENVAKAVLDAATGVLWTDDAQVARLDVRKMHAAQGDAPHVIVSVQPLPADNEPLMWPEPIGQP